MSFIVCAFFTPEYESELQHLKESCEKFDYSYHFKGYPSRGKWQVNTYIKPEFLREMLDKFPDKDILYLDADAIIKLPLDLFDCGINDDFSMFIAPVAWRDGKRWPTSEVHAYLSGTMYFTNNDNSKLFLDAWIAKRKKYPKLHGDQALIPKVLGEDKLDVKITPLPIEYVKIFDKRVPCGDPVIIHNQASRRLKRKIKMDNKLLKVGNYDYQTTKETRKYSELHKEEKIDSVCKTYTSWFKPRLVTNIPNIVDLGCGLGTLRQYINYKTYLGVDIAKEVIEDLRKDAGENEVFLHNDVAQMNTEQEFDIAFCLDTLQHLPEPLIFEALERMKQYSKTQIISVNTKRSKIQAFDKSVIHITIKNADWWIKTISTQLNIRDRKKSDSGIIFFCGENYQDPDSSIKIPFNIRKSSDGSYFLPRRDRTKETFMDKHFARVHNQLKWYPKVEDELSIANLAGKAKGGAVYIIGKGPSLDNISKDLFLDNGPVIALNEAINKVQDIGISNKIYLLQQDAGLSCQPQGPVILHDRIRHLHAYVNQRYLFNKHNFNAKSDPLSVIAAIRVAKIMGAKQITLISFDASTNQNTNYAECIGHPPKTVNGNTPTRFLGHKSLIMQELGRVPTTWLTPLPLV